MTTTVNAEALTINTRSFDLPFIAGGGAGNAVVASPAADGWIIRPPTGEVFDERLVLILGSDGSGGTITFNGGTRYPAQRADLGDMVITLAADDGRVIVIETSRFTKVNGTIIAIPSTTGLVMTAIQLPKAL